MIKRIILIVSLIISSIIQIGNGYLDLKRQQPDNLRIRAGKCGPVGPWINPEVNQMDWTNKNDLHINITVPSICESGGWVGNYVIEDENHLILEYEAALPSASACLCPRELRYKIKDIKKKDYTISLRPME